MATFALSWFWWGTGSAVEVGILLMLSDVVACCEIRILRDILRTLYICLYVYVMHMDMSKTCGCNHWYTEVGQIKPLSNIIYYITYYIISIFTCNEIWEYKSKKIKRKRTTNLNSFTSNRIPKKKKKKKRDLGHQEIIGVRLEILDFLFLWLIGL